jgi:hypothetical protein
MMVVTGSRSFTAFHIVQVQAGPATFYFPVGQGFRSSCVDLVILPKFLYEFMYFLLHVF